MDENVLGNVVGSLIDRNKDDWGGGNGIIWIILLFFLFGGGMWGNRNPASTQDVATSNMFTQVDNGIRGLSSGQAQASYENLSQFNNTNMSVMGGFANLNQAVNEVGFKTQHGFCETNRNIDAVRYENAQNTCAITSNDTANTQKILDAICSLKSEAKDNTIAQLRSDLQAAQLTLANGVQTQNIIGAIRPYPQPAYLTASPYTGYYGTSVG